MFTSMHSSQKCYPFAFGIIVNFCQNFIQMIFEIIVPDDYRPTYLQVASRRSCGWEAIAMAADDALTLNIILSKCVIAVDGSKVKILRSGTDSILVVVNVKKT